MKKDTYSKSKMNVYEKTRTALLDVIRTHFLKGDLDTIQKKFNAIPADETDKRAALDQVLRDYLLEQLTSSKSKNNDTVNQWEKYVNNSILMCQRSLCTATMPVVLLADVFDALTLGQCECLFTYVEDNVAVWKEPLFFTPCKNNLLRMCNDLLRRLSRSQNTVFCGRILLFLAKFFPFSERSGLNIVSEFNLDNVTEYGNDNAESLKEMLAEEESEKDDDFRSDIKITIDYNLYSKFWSLQDFFRNPNQCYNKVHWKTFSSHASSVLSAFSSFKLDEVSESKRHKPDTLSPSNNHDQESKMDVEDESSLASSHTFFAKFLTNQKLLELQLSDSNFRRYVLLQFLMLFQYLESQVKFKPDNYELKQDQIDWVKETIDTVYKLINETPPDGPDFVAAVKHILKREEQWNNWKNDGCKEFQKPVAPQESVDTGLNERKRPLRPRRRGKPLGDLLQESIAQGKAFMGNSELTKLWNVCPDNLEACRARDRDFLPSLDVYFEEAIEQADPSAMVEDEYKKINDGNFGWRALRLLARRSPHFFTPSSNNISKLPEYLETMIKKIAKERPSTGTSTAPVEESRAEILDARTEENGAENEQDEDELLKTMKGDDHKEEDNETKKSLAFNKKLIETLANALASDWKKLALKLSYPQDMIDMLVNQYSEDVTRARKFLEMYAENDEDENPENLAYTLEGLGLIKAANVINNAD